MFAFTLLLLCANDDLAQLTLVPNTTEILQRDNLLLMGLLENKSESAIAVFSQLSVLADIRVELLEGDKWGVLRRTGEGGIIPGAERRLMMGKTSYVEFNALFLRGNTGEFLFEKPGKYQLRAVAKMPWGEMPSQPITITVKKRSAADLETIDKHKIDLPLALVGGGIELPEKTLDLRVLGGNIGHTIEQSRMLLALAVKREWEGESVPLEKIPGWLRKKLDPVSSEFALLQLGGYFLGNKDWNGLHYVISNLQNDSIYKHEFTHELKQGIKVRFPPPRDPWWRADRNGEAKVT